MTNKLENHKIIGKNFDFQIEKKLNQGVLKMGLKTINVKS